MSKLSEILRLHYLEYIKKFGPRMPSSHRKVFDAIMNCRKGKYGVSIFECEKCGGRHFNLNCCGNRHCPICQNDKNEKWLKKQMEALLPCNYFLITFTVPQELRSTALNNQEQVYSGMFKASKDALSKLAQDPKYIGKGETGFFGVLHTWGRQITYHPHIHYIVPGGAMSKNGNEWISARDNYFVPAKALARIYKAKLRDILKKKGFDDIEKTGAWQKEWVINTRAVGNGKSSLKYLAPYVFRVAISENRIISYDKNTVTFLYKKTGNSRYRKMTLNALEFIRRFLLHVLPDGFMKIRHYGFLNGNSKIDIKTIRRIISSVYEIIDKINEKNKKERKQKFSCQRCGSESMKMVFFCWSPVYFSSA